MESETEMRVKVIAFAMMMMSVACIILREGLAFSHSLSTGYFTNAPTSPEPMVQN